MSFVGRVSREIVAIAFCEKRGARTRKRSARGNAFSSEFPFAFRVQPRRSAREGACPNFRSRYQLFLRRGEASRQQTRRLE